MTSKILVTGGAGYIGSHTVVELLQEGHDVHIIDNLSNSTIEVLDRITEITGKAPHFTKLDLLDQSDLQYYFEDHAPFDGVIHFAAAKAVGESVEKPLYYYENNIVGLINLLIMLKIFQVPHLVFSSSCTVYGQPKILPVTENSPLQPATSPYGNTKRIAEEIIEDSVKANSDLQAIALRYFNPIGAHETALIGELPNGVPNNLMPFICQTAIGKRKELNVFGNDYPTPDGTAIRDYIHVVDLAKAHLAALHRMTEKRMDQPIEYYNIGCSKGYSVLEVIHAFEQETGVKLNWQFAPRRAGDIEQIWADATLAEQKLNWKAEKGIGEMVASAWKWEKRLETRE
jgi:UDP-glucose 4-epimerase